MNKINMKLSYTPPVVKVVSFMTEAGFQTSPRTLSVQPELDDQPTEQLGTQSSWGSYF